MALESILREVELLHDVSKRLSTLAEQYIRMCRRRS